MISEYLRTLSPEARAAEIARQVAEHARITAAIAEEQREREAKRIKTIAQARQHLEAAGVVFFEFRMEWYKDEDDLVDYRILDAQERPLVLPPSRTERYLTAYAWALYDEVGTGTFRVDVRTGAWHAVSDAWSNWTDPDDEDEAEYDDES